MSGAAADQRHSEQRRGSTGALQQGTAHPISHMTGSVVEIELLFSVLTSDRCVLFLSEHQSSAAAVSGHCAGAPVHAGRSEFQRDRDAEVSKHSQRPFLRSVSFSSTVHL